MQNSAAPPPNVRFDWVDGVRGLSILWIAVFHGFITYGGRYPWLRTFDAFPPFIAKCAPTSVFGKFSCAIEGIVAGLFQKGSEGVGVFLLFSGFGLTYSLLKRGGGEPSWKTWYRQRLIRLLPLYWLAHIIFLVSPFQLPHDPIDYRFVLSFFGDRIYPVSEVFYYLVPAWWFIGLLLQLYIVFPFLFRLLQRLGSMRFLVLCIVVTCAARYLISEVIQANGLYIQGAFFACRLWEFAAGMVFGKLMIENPARTMKYTFSWKCLLAGLIIYWLGLSSYQPNFLYSFSDGLGATGLSIIMIHLAVRIDRIPYVGKAVAGAGIYSYGIYLFHQPYLMYLGRELVPYPMGVFIVLTALALVLIASASMCLKKTLDKLTRRYLIR
jgi:peptidoglycan/LPS O-acetylase OafA/YrhL